MVESREISKAIEKKVAELRNELAEATTEKYMLMVVSKIRALTEVLNMIDNMEADKLNEMFKTMNK